MAGISFAALFGLLVVLWLLTLLKVEKLVRLTFGLLFALLFSLAFGLLLQQLADGLLGDASLRFLGFSYEQYASFLLAAQPTMSFVFSALLVWLFVQRGTLQLEWGGMLGFGTVQSLLWACLSLGNLLSYLYFSLAFFKWGWYEWLMQREVLHPYLQYLPWLGMLTVIVMVVCASRFRIKFSVRMTDDPVL